MKKISAVLVVLALATVASADLVAEYRVASQTPTVDLPGYMTLVYEVRMYDTETMSDLPFNAIDVAITGSLNQVNPFGTSETIFQDNNHLFQHTTPPSDVLQDSQFLFVRNDVLTDGSLNEESESLLKAGFSTSGIWEGWTPMFQIATDAPSGVEVAGVVPEYGNSSNEIALVPEPATMSLLAIGGLGALIRRKRR